MTALSTLLTLLLVSAGLAAVTLATVRLVRSDRSATPPGRSDDWREAELAWSRLGIS